MIEVNDYVRTDKGKITKIVGIDEFIDSTTFYETEDNPGYMDLCNKNIVKHSKQLIDLIEVKDVIKYRIDNISTTLETKGYLEGIIDISDEEMLQEIKRDKDYHILEILTHEQFEANCYKVGGEDE